MRQIIYVIACAALANVLIGSALIAQTRAEVCTVQVTGMTCSGCAAAVKLAARTVAGVKDVQVSYETGRADVTYDPAKTTPVLIAKAIASKTGYKAEVQNPKTKR